MSWFSSAASPSICHPFSSFLRARPLTLRPTIWSGAREKRALSVHSPALVPAWWTAGDLEDRLGVAAAGEEALEARGVAEVEHAELRVALHEGDAPLVLVVGDLEAGEGLLGGGDRHAGAQGVEVVDQGADLGGAGGEREVAGELPLLAIFDQLKGCPRAVLEADMVHRGGVELHQRLVGLNDPSKNAKPPATRADVCRGIFPPVLTSVGRFIPGI